MTGLRRRWPSAPVAASAAERVEMRHHMRRAGHRPRPRPARRTRPSGALVPTRCLSRPACLRQPLHRGAHAAALRVAQQRRQAGRPAIPIRTGCSMPRSRSRAIQSQDRLGVEAELRDDMDREPGLLRRLDLGRQRVLEHLRRNARMAFRIAGNADLVDAVALQQPAFDHIERAGERPRRPVAVAGDHQHAAHAGLRRETATESRRARARWRCCAPRDAAPARSRPRAARCAGSIMLGAGRAGTELR